MKSNRTVFCILFLFVSAVMFANGISLNSIGSRAFGMGGAFVAVADDATAIHWNPAGLAGQRGSILLFGTDVVPMSSYRPLGSPVKYKSKINHYITPNLFANYSYGKWGFGLSAFFPAGIGVEYDEKKLGGFKTSNKIGIMNISPAAAYQINEYISVGAGLNFYYGLLELHRMQSVPVAPGVEMPFQYNEDISGWGVGASFGVKVTPSEDLSFGLSIKTPYKVTLKGDSELGPMKFKAERKVTFPLWVGIGAAGKFAENLLVSIDMQYSGWSELKTFDLTLDPGKATEQKTSTRMDWLDQVQFRIGSEYNLNKNIDLRLGYYHDPAPSPDKTLIMLFPSGTYNVGTAGFTYKTGCFRTDFGIEYLFGIDRHVPLGDEQPGKHRVDVFSFSFGVGYNLQ